MKVFPLTILLLFVSFGSTFSSCKKGEGKLDADKIGKSEFNQKIEGLLSRAVSEKDPNIKAKLYGEASDLLSEKGDLKRMYETALLGKKENPLQKQCLTSIAEYHFRKGNKEEAKIQLTDLLSRESDFPRANFLFGLILMQSEKPKLARSYFQKAHSVDAENPEYALNWLVSVYESGDKRKALDSISTLTEKFPKYGPLWKNVGLIQEAMGKKKEATLSYETYLQLNENGTDVPAVKKWISNLK